MELLLAGALAFVAGTAFGIFGAGGSILIVPILVYVLGLPVKTSLGMALLILVVTGGIAALAHARSGNVRWRLALQWAATSIVGAYAGGRLAEFVPAEVLLAMFAVIVLGSAVGMLRKSGPTRRERALCAGPSFLRIAVVGMGLGLLNGTIGVGGGYLLVPALVLLCGLELKLAIGTALLIISINSLGGFLGFAAHAHFPFVLTMTIAAFAAVGSLVGERLGKSLPASRLRPAFAVFLLLLGTAMIVENVIELVSSAPR